MGVIVNVLARFSALGQESGRLLLLSIEMLGEVVSVLGFKFVGQCPACELIVNNQDALFGNEEGVWHVHHENEAETQTNHR